MGCSDIDSLSSNSSFKQRKLKDFLIHDSYSVFSDAFNPLPTYPYLSTIENLIHNDLNAATKLSPSRSAFRSMINAFKNIHFTAIKPPSILPRTISRKLSKKKETQTKLATVTIKDIIRWKSFRDLSEDKSPPLDLLFSPHHCTTATTPCSSNGSSWCESDFTAEDFPSGDNEGKNYLPCVGEDSAEAAITSARLAVGPKQWNENEHVKQKQQNSPNSVIDIKFNLEKWVSMDGVSDEEEGHDGTLTNTSYEEEEEESTDDVEEKAWQLYNHVKDTSSVGDQKKLVLDFFRDEISKRGYNEAFDNEMLSRVKEWINGENGLWIGWEKREACVREMDKDGKWSKFDEEQREMAMEIENRMVGLLVDELLLDFLYSSSTGPLCQCGCITSNAPVVRLSPKSSNVEFMR